MRERIINAAIQIHHHGNHEHSSHEYLHKTQLSLSTMDHRAPHKAFPVTLMTAKGYHKVGILFIDGGVLGDGLGHYVYSDADFCAQRSDYSPDSTLS